MAAFWWAALANGKPLGSIRPQLDKAGEGGTRQQGQGKGAKEELCNVEGGMSDNESVISMSSFPTVGTPTSPAKSNRGEDEDDELFGDEDDLETLEPDGKQNPENAPEEAPVVLVRDPADPTPAERALHDCTHIPFRGWCPVCVWRHALVKTRTIS